VGVDFPLPGPNERMLLWLRALAGAPYARELNLPFLAERLALSGGEILNVVVAASYLAAEEGGEIDTERVAEALRGELGKMGRLVDPYLLQPAAPPCSFQPDVRAILAPADARSTLDAHGPVPVGATRSRRGDRADRGRWQRRATWPAAGRLPRHRGRARTTASGEEAGGMSGKIFDLTPETEGQRRPVRRSASWEYGSSAGEVYLARKRALERAAEDALRDAAWAVRRRAARGQEGGEDAVTLALTLRRRGVDEEVWEREVRRAAADRAEGTAYLARKREERLARQAAEAAEGVSLPAASMSEAGVVQAQAEVGREGGALSPALSGRIQAKRGGGQPLDATVRRGMEGVFQVSFGHVRIHADPEADALNRGVAAIAFTVGSDIFVRAGAYQPHGAAGQHLLAHELTHVVQQRAGSLGTSGGGGNSGGGTMTVGAADDRHEVEAEATAHRVTATLQRRALLAQATTPGAGIARQHDPEVALAPAASGVARVAAPDTTIRRWPWDDAINAVKGKVDDVLRGLPGFELLTVLLGQDPISGRQVARTPQSLAHAVLSLAPGGDALYQKLEEHKVLAKLISYKLRIFGRCQGHSHRF